MADTTRVSETIGEDTSELLKAMLGMAETAAEPGTFKVKDVIHKGDGDVPMPIVASALSSAGYAYIYDRKTGERSLTNRNMLPAQLQKRNSAGEVMFTLERPVTPPVRGVLKCLLHPDERKPEYDRWGLVTCPKSNLMSLLEVEHHCRRRHPRAWEIIERERVKTEKAEERERQERYQREVLAMLAARPADNAGPETRRRLGPVQ